MVKVTLDTFYQEFKDSQKYLIETLTEIKEQVKHTNGRVKDLEINNAVLDKGYLDICNNISKHSVSNNFNKTFWVSIISISLALLTFILKLANIV